MADSENDGSNKQTTGNNAQEEASIYEDEINLIDYFQVLWKRKWFIFLASVLPALVVGFSIFLWPRDYRITYTYDVRDDVRDDVSNWNLNEKNFNVLQSRFYSEDNLNRIIDKLQQNKLDEYAGQVRNFKADASNKFVEFEVSPPFVDLSKLKVADAGQLDKLRAMKAFLLNMTIKGKPLEDIGKIALVIRDNFENVTSVYMVQEQLSTEIRTHRTRMADIESNKFSLKLALKTNSSALEKLKSMKSQTQDEVESNVLLQFDIGNNSKYLPLGYQIQALESEIVSLEKQAETNKENYEYYKNLLVLNEKLLAEIKKSISSYYTIQQYQTFLIKQIEGYEADELKDYLASYIKRIENRIAASVPVSETPKISSIAKGTVKKSAIVFAIALMISVFATFLREGLEKNQAQAS